MGQQLRSRRRKGKVIGRGGEGVHGAKNVSQTTCSLRSGLVTRDDDDEDYFCYSKLVDELYADDDMGGNGGAQKPPQPPTLMALCVIVVLALNCAAVYARGSRRSSVRDYYVNEDPTVSRGAFEEIGGIYADNERISAVAKLMARPVNDSNDVEDDGGVETAPSSPTLLGRDKVLRGEEEEEMYGMSLFPAPGGALGDDDDEKEEEEKTVVNRDWEEEFLENFGIPFYSDVDRFSDWRRLAEERNMSINHTKAPPRALSDSEPVIAPQDSGYASGTSAVFWLKGDLQDDYPYLCKCDPTTLQQFQAGLPIEIEDTSSWWNPFSNSPSEHSSGVPCTGSFSDSLLSSGVPFCDAINTSSPRQISASLSLFMAVILSVFLLH